MNSFLLKIPTTVFFLFSHILLFRFFFLLNKLSAASVAIERNSTLSIYIHFHITLIFI